MNTKPKAIFSPGKRFAKTIPGAAFIVHVTKEVLKDHKRTDERIATARKEIEDGARPKKGRFRL